MSDDMQLDTIRALAADHWPMVKIARITGLTRRVVQYRATGGGQRGIQSASLSASVLEEIRVTGGGSVSEIARCIGVTPAEASHAILRLHRAGLLLRPRRGVYCLPGQDAPRSDDQAERAPGMGEREIVASRPSSDESRRVARMARTLVQAGYRVRGDRVEGQPEFSAYSKLTGTVPRHP